MTEEPKKKKFFEDKLTKLQKLDQIKKDREITQNSINNASNANVEELEKEIAVKNSLKEDFEAELGIDEDQTFNHV